MIKLTGITWENPRGYDPLVRASAIYQDQNPHIRVEWEQYPWYEFEKRILNDFANKTNVYDLIMFDHPWTGTISVKDWILPWDDYLPAGYFDELKNRVVAPSTESYFLNGKHWALPLDAASHCALYQKVPSLNYQLPNHWEDIKMWAIQMQKAGFDTPLVLSIQGVLGSCLFLSMMAAYGKPAFSNPTQENIDIEAAKYILNLIKELQAFCPAGSSSWGPWDIYENFRANNQLLYSPSIFAYVNYVGEENSGPNLYLSTTPSFRHNNLSRAILGGVGLGLTRTCKNVAEAVKYGTFLMSDEIQKDVFPTNNGQPALKAVWEDEMINRQFNYFYSCLKPNMENGYIRPRYSGFHEVELAIGETLQSWWDNESSVDKVIEKLNKIKSRLNG